MAIRKLSVLLVNQIAAGEVIERPASVVKELVENSLDAGATRIDITIEDGGKQLIRVSDNGAGIPADELPLAVAPHATSKLRSSEDLEAIRTLGFRGEALASMASVGRLRLTSRATSDGRVAEAGATLEASGDAAGAVEPAACAPGTVVEVRDLFFNTPARRKFMRGAPTEFGHIAEAVSRIAMARPGVAFTLAHNGRKVIDAVACEQRPRNRVVEMLGKELDEALLEFELALPGMPDRNGEAPAPGRVWGLAGLPAIARATAKFQYLYLNGRPIRDRSLSHAVKEAYRGLVPPDKQPVAAVFLEIDPRAADVNVHPAKAEVRFRDPSQVHGLVLTAIRQRLLGADLTPSAELRDGLPIAHFQLPIDEEASVGSAGVPLPIGNGQSAMGNLTARSFVDYFRRMDPRERGFVYEEVRKAIAETPGIPAGLDSAFDPAGAKPQAAGGGNGAHDGLPGVPAVLRSQGVLQIHQSYLVTQDDEGLLIVDQHALHERVMFEELRRRIAGQNLESQRLLMPTIVRASPRRQALLDPLRPLLERIGVEAEPIGPGELAVHAFPSFLFDRRVEPGPFLEELLDRAEDGQLDLSNAGADEAVLHEVLDMMACRAAVKAGDEMQAEELAALLAKREEIERSSNCPHGRPTTIRLTLRELEKQFKRA